MCGIAGELAVAGSKSNADWNKISGLMKARGPDDEGSWADKHCQLVFRRLSILDLTAAGHQPMVSHDENYALTFNGELYNFRELRAELVQKGVQFRSNGDTEVVLQALIHWGVDALEKFNGMFAFAFYNARKQSLLLVRDHAGIKPLYFLKTKQGVAFASQYDQILAHPWRLGMGISEQALSLYLHLGFVPAPYAMLQNTFMLEPGAWVEFSANGESRSGKHFRFPQFQEPNLSGNEALEALDGALQNSVKRQLVSDVPVASFLSGGVDSPLVLAKMLQAGGGPYRAYTIGTEDQATDESVIAEDFAQQLGVAQTLQKISQNDAYAMLDEVVTASGEPFGDYSIFPTMLVSKLAAKDFKVILSGDGGDELLWGYVKRMSEGISAAPSFARNKFARRAEFEVRKVFGRHRDHQHLNHASEGDLHAFKHLLLRGGHLQRIFPQLASWPEDYDKFSFAPSQPDPNRTAQWIRYNEFNTHLTKVLLKVDRASMSQSLEVRVPILDKEFIEVAQRVSWQSCLDMSSGIGKIPLRQILDQHVQRQSSQKRGFEVPMGDWLKHSLKDLVHDVLLNRNELLGVPLDRIRMNKLYAQHVSGEVQVAQGLWPVLSLALWEAKHLNG